MGILRAYRGLLVDRALIRLLFGEFVSSIGDWLYLVALLVIVYDRSKDPVLLSVVGGATWRTPVSNRSWATMFMPPSGTLSLLTMRPVTVATSGSASVAPGGRMMKVIPVWYSVAYTVCSEKVYPGAVAWTANLPGPVSMLHSPFASDVATGPADVWAGME